MLFVAALLAFGWLGGPHQIDRQVLKVSGWNVRVDKDRFTGAVSCKAVRRDIYQRGGVVVLKLGPDANTGDAVYRIDDGAAHSVHEVDFRLRVLGAPVTLEPVDNPSRGVVVLPAADLLQADHVYVRATSKDYPQRFIVRGLAGVIAQERQSGCPGGA